MKTKLLEDLKTAMKEKDIIRKNAIQLVRAEIVQFEKDNKVELSNEDVIDLIAKITRKRENTLSEFMKTDRVDLIENLKVEIEILKSYLPKQLSIEELKNIVQEVIVKTNATSMKDMKAIKEEIEPEIKGKADMKTVSQLVKELLMTK